MNHITYYLVLPSCEGTFISEDFLRVRKSIKTFLIRDGNIFYKQTKVKKASNN